MTGKDFVTTAISGDPHASLAWAGVLMFLPILLNPVTQDEDALAEFEEICHVLIRSEVVERRLWKEPQSSWTTPKLLHQNLEQAKSRIQLPASWHAICLLELNSVPVSFRRIRTSKIPSEVAKHMKMDLKCDISRCSRLRRFDIDFSTWPRALSSDS
ncbi:hypothetical protein EAF04_002619 [Stromatinia cepivora]|nr:hypothetical protein EAF04_002619 [Stromatinia cepivora]